MDTVQIKQIQGSQISIGSVELFKIHRERGYRAPLWREREQYAINFIEKGSTRYFFDSKSVAAFSTAQEGDLLFFPIGAKYAIEFDKSRVTDFCTIRFSIVGGRLSDALRSPLKIHTEAARKLVCSLFSGDEQQIDAHRCYEVLYQLLSLLENASADAVHVCNRLDPAVKYISQNFQEHREISYYAALCHMSVTNFRRLFARHYGTTPTQYRNGVRLERARSLLRSNLVNVSEAARACGFESISFFCKLYKEKFGYSPKKEHLD